MNFLHWNVVLNIFRNDCRNDLGIYLLLALLLGAGPQIIMINDDPIMNQADIISINGLVI